MTDLDTTPATVILDWRHPYLGDVVEPVCDAHDVQVRGALRLLGIGSGGRAPGAPTACSRCAHPELTRAWQVRAWIVDYLSPRDSTMTRLRNWWCGTHLTNHLHGVGLPYRLLHYTGWWPR